MYQLINTVTNNQEFESQATPPSPSPPKNKKQKQNKISHIRRKPIHVIILSC